MSVEPLIALEAAQEELGSLYTAARSFTALRARAEAELLPGLLALGSRMRSLLRARQLTQGELDAAAKEILSLRSSWRAELDRVRASVPYQAAVAALAADRQDELAQLIPHVVAHLAPFTPAPTLCFPVSPASARRRAGTSPFLSAVECADRIMRLLAEGIMPEQGGAQWWERELPSIGCADAAEALETPIALRLQAADVRVAVFGSSDAAGLRIFTPRLRAPMAVVLASEATDEWWEAYEDSYDAFRDALHRELVARSQSPCIVSPSLSGLSQ